MMTSRERLLCVLNGDVPDRVPVSPFVQEDFLSDYFNKSGTDRLLDGIACAKELDFDLMAKENKYGFPHFMRKSYPNWQLDIKTFVEKGNYYKITTIKTPLKELKQVEVAPYDEKSITGIHVSTTEYLIKDESDFEAFNKYVPEMDKADVEFILEGGRFAKKSIEDVGISNPWGTGGVYNQVSNYIDIQNMMMDSLTDEEYYQAYMSKFADLIGKSNEIFAISEFDSVGVAGNIANGSMVGESFFNQHILPYETIALKPLIQANKPTIYHNCGYAKKLYSCYKTLGVTCWETIAQLPQGDNCLQDAKEFFGTSIVLCGTLDQVVYLKNATPEEIFALAAQTVLIGKPNAHYIFAASDFLEKGTPIENIRAMIAGAKSTAAY